MRDKSRRSIWLGVFFAGVLLAVFYACFHRGASNPAVNAGWGRGKLKVSETAYYTNRVREVIESWQRSIREVQCGQKDGRCIEPYDVYLVVDANRPGIWVENKGVIRENDYAELPARYTWRVYRTFGGENKLMGPKVRLKIRGRYQGRELPELFQVGGEASGLGQMDFSIRQHGFGTGYGSGSFRPGISNDPVVEGKDYYESMLVSDEEYEHEQQRFAAARESATTEADDSRILANKGRWRKVEKQIYQMIEAAVNGLGLSLDSLELRAGPDYSAASAEISARRDSPVGRFFGGNPYTEGDVEIDRIGDDVWYVRSVSRGSGRGMPRMQAGELEFLVSAPGEMPAGEYDNWMKKVRLPAGQPGQPNPKWQVSLRNGTTVEFVGVCESPSAGKQWWGPDGSMLGYEPYYRKEDAIALREDLKVFQIAWRIHWGGNVGGATKTSVEGNRGISSGRILDRHGRVVYDLLAEAYFFDKDRKMTTVRLEIGAGKEGSEWVEFRNVSLAAGENFGFEAAHGR